MEDYRQDEQRRCSRCSAPTAYEDLFLTTEGESLCKDCRLTWAEEQRKTAGVEKGPRLVCPTCALASMKSRGGFLYLSAKCPRCGKTATRLQGGAVLAATALLMWMGLMAAMFRFGLVLLGLAVLACFMAAGRDLVNRQVFRKATFEEIEEADRALALEAARRVERAYERRVGAGAGAGAGASAGASAGAGAEREGVEAEGVEDAGEAPRDRSTTDA